MAGRALDEYMTESTIAPPNRNKIGAKRHAFGAKKRSISRSDPPNLSAYQTAFGGSAGLLPVPITCWSKSMTAPVMRPDSALDR